MAESTPRDTTLDIPTICFGFTLGFLTLTASTVGQQTISIYKRRRGIFSLYLFMIWLELIVNFAWSVLSWLFLCGQVKGGLPFLISLVSMWVIQTQCLLQIIANRVALIMTNQRRARWLKISLLLIVGAINISVYCIWIPARMEVSDTFVEVNRVWDRIEKVIYLFLDLALNVYFLYLVRSKLISKGLHKYQPLFRFNAGIVIISISMDILIISMMSLKNDMIYIQFHPLAYIVKLNIELSMADLISKVVRRQDRTDKPNSSSDPSKSTELTSKSRVKSGVMSGVAFQLSTQAKANDFQTTITTRSQSQAQQREKIVDDGSSDSSSVSGINFAVPENGIVKTTATDVVIHDENGRQHNLERGSTSSSTAHLNDYAKQPYGHAK